VQFALRCDLPPSISTLTSRWKPVQRLGVAVPGTTPPDLYDGAGGRRRSPASARFADAAPVGLDMQALDNEHPVAGAVGRGVDSG
jgi:hypothetical protein